MKQSIDYFVACGVVFIDKNVDRNTEASKCLHKSDFHCCFSVTSLQLHWETGFSIYFQPLSSICIMVILIGSQLSRRWVMTNTSVSEGQQGEGGV